MARNWTIADILDLEYFVDQDTQAAGKEEEELHRRDRQLLFDSQLEGKKREERLLTWLSARKKEKGQHLTPGIIFLELHGLSRILLPVAGGILGGGLAFSYYRYSGTTPINVFQFYTLFLLPQLILLFVLVLRSPLRYIFRLHTGQGDHTIRLIAGIITRLIHRFDKADRTDLVSRYITGRLHLVFWPIFNATQLFGIAYNIAILVVSLFAITTMDLAFGWQSTLAVSPERLHALVTTLASPWTPLFNSLHPGLADIEGSRIILKDGIEHLQTANLTSWWPFLLMSLATYGLLPRILTYFWGVFGCSIFLRRQLDAGKYDIILERMTTPVVNSQAPLEETALRKDSLQQTSSRSIPATGPSKAAGYVADDVYGTLSLEDINHMLAPTALTVTGLTRVLADPAEDAQLLEALARQIDTDEGAIIILEGWMVPLTETIRFVQRFEQALGTTRTPYLLLVGRPAASGHPMLAQPKDMHLWQQQLAAISSNITCIAAETSHNEAHVR